MRKASMVLGIVGGGLSLLAALLFIIGGIVFMATDPSLFENLFDNMYMDMDYIAGFIFNMTGNIIGVVFIVFGVIKAVCGVLGLVGGLSVKNKNVTAGVLMIVAAGLSLLLSGGWITMILFTLGGIFALVKEKPPVVTPPQYPVQ